jgi:hypothetical protein
MNRVDSCWKKSKKNVNLCIADKTPKIMKVRAKYPEWWLVFSDLIAYGLDEFGKFGDA